VTDLPLIVFDVNETLLDLGTMEPTFQRIFGDKGAMRLWFANLILYSAALTVAGCYVPFTDIGAAVMKMLADTRGIKINDSDRKELTEKFSTMPPHPEVPAALRKLRSAGFRLFCLTDNLLEVQTRQLTHGGIVDLFERRFSADGVKHHKPSRQAYGYVEKELGVKPSELCMIACHTWDTLGAVAAGWRAALIKRVGNDVLGVGPQPQIVGTDLNDVADQLIARHKGRSNSSSVHGLGSKRMLITRQYPLWVKSRHWMSSIDVRFTPKSGHWNSIEECPLCAKSGLSHCNERAYSTISSAAAKNRLWHAEPKCLRDSQVEVN
jgi:2-haloacid dehalogenase